MKTPNNLHKKSAAAAAGFLMCFFLSGCQLFVVGGQKLSEYCPGLHAKLDSISWHESHSANTYILNINQSYRKKVANYFADPANGYTKAVGRTYYNQNIKEGMTDAIDTTTVGKIINRRSYTTATVYFDVTTGRVIIIEKAKKGPHNKTGAQ